MSDDWGDVKLKWFETTYSTEMMGENLDYDVRFQILNPGQATVKENPRLSIKLSRKTEKYMRESILPTCFFVLAAWVRLTFLIWTLKFIWIYWILEGAILVPPQKVNFFGAPIQMAPEYNLNLRWQLSSSILRFAAHTLNFGVFTVTKHPFKKGFYAKKSKLKFF